MRIFDFHTHVYPDVPGGFWKNASSADQLVAAMDAAGVTMAAVIAIAPHIPNAVVEGAARRHPTRLVPIGSVDPLDRDAVEQIDQAVTGIGARGIKIHPRLQSLRLEHLDGLVPLADRCADHGIPLVVCSFLGGSDLFSGRALELCHELAQRCRRVSLVLAHAGGHRPLDALMIAKANPNVYLDLSFSPIYFRGSSVVQDLAFLVQRAHPERLLFGSDFPEAPMADSVGFVVHLAEELRLDHARLEGILYGNAARLLGVVPSASDTPCA